MATARMVPARGGGRSATRKAECQGPRDPRSPGALDFRHLALCKLLHTPVVGI